MTVTYFKKAVNALNTGTETMHGVLAKFCLRVRPRGNHDSPRRAGSRSLVRPIGIVLAAFVFRTRQVSRRAKSEISFAIDDVHRLAEAPCKSTHAGVTGGCV